METNHHAAKEDPNQSSTEIRKVVTEHAQSQTTRSYQCSFCKKGFSNAQALGGHMNVHRKDKAKLKQTSKGAKMVIRENAITADSLNDPRTIRKPTEFTSGQRKVIISPILRGILISPPEQENTSSPCVTDESHTADPKQLPLFVDDTPTSHSSSHGGGSSFRAELDLDLELRLGRSCSAPPGSSVSTGIRKFF